jgi:hypothetical protein
MPRLGLVPAVLGFVLCSACASVRVRHAKDAGTAGGEWAKAADAVLRVAEETAVDADSARLLSEAQGLPKESRREVLEKHAAVSTVVADLERLRRHARLLGRYFDRLHDLSDGAADSSVEDATSKAADAVVTLGSEVSGSKLLTAAERDAISRTARLAARAGREAALSRELAARGDVIAKELELERAALDAVRRTIRADAATLRELGLARDVVRPYLENAVGDPSGWIAARRTFVLPADPSEALATASDAASRLKSAWAALVEGRFDAAAWSTVVADAGEVIAYVKLLQEARKEARK